MAANPQTKPIDLGCESAENWQLPSTSTIAIVIITQPVSWCSFYRPTEGGRLSRPRHCSKGAQPVPKPVYRSGCHDKHNVRGVIRTWVLSHSSRIRGNHSATENCNVDVQLRCRVTAETN